MTDFVNYREISAKLKKRFSLRKPNYIEAANAFKKLANDLVDFKEYSGFCLYSAAQCHHNMVVLLQEQKQKSNSGGNLLAQTSRPTSRPGTAVASSSSKSPTPLFSSSELGKDRLLQIAQQTETQTWLETARLLREADEVNGAIAAFSHASQTCLDSERSMIYFEWAHMLLDKRMFVDAADIFLEGGMVREAVEVLMTGQYFEDAFFCYQQLLNSFQKNPLEVSHKTPIELVNTEPTETKTTKNSLNFFGKKILEPTILETSPTTLRPTHSLPRKCDQNPFVHHPFFTVDDHINMFLLKLYLNDASNHEHPSPIIPFGEEMFQCNNDIRLLFGSNDANGTFKDDEDNFAPHVHDSKLVLGKCDTHMGFPEALISQSSSKIKRTVDDLVEVNILFETLFSSLKNELKHTIDHQLKNENEEKSFDSTLSHASLDAPSKTPSSPAQPNQDDTNNNDLDSFEALLGQLTAQRDDFEQSKDVQCKSLEETLVYQSKMQRFEGDSDLALRVNIQMRLFKLLTSKQNQLLALILNK